MENILVTLLVNLGDVIIATGALRLLRDNYPDAKIDVLVRPEVAEVLRHNPDINEVMVYPYKSKSTFYKLRETVAAVREKRYDVSLSLDRRLRSALVAFLARIPKRLGTSILFRNCKPKTWTRILYTKLLPLPPVDCASVAEMFNIIMRRAFNLSGSRPVRPLPVLPESAAKADGLLGGAGRPVIGLCVRALASLKNWPAERFAELMTRLKRDLGAFLYVTGSPSDSRYVDDLLGHCPEGTAENFAGKTSLMDTVALAARSDLFITLDTGTLHMVAHCGVPRVICLFCSTCPDNMLHAIPRTTSVLWSGEKCSPCFVKPEDCPEQHACANNITVDMVYDEACRLLKDFRAPAALPEAP